MLKQITGDIRKIFGSYEKDLTCMEGSLRELFASNVFLIPLIGRYLIEGGGKRMRPLFLLVSARLAGYEGEDHISLSSVIESIHTASLLHDDVVDGADVRRGRSAAHVTWGNQVVVLVGDFLYANALRRAVSCGDVRIVGALSQAVTSMSEGELLQLEKSGDVNITEEDYVKIIASKTGVLISTACRIGGLLGGVSAEQEEALASFGLKAGIAFQMADDILDYVAGQENGFGKKLGKDLEEGKITLPLIYLLRQAGLDESAEIKTILEGSPSPKGLDRIRELFKKYDAVGLALEKAREFLKEAKAETSVLRDCPERQELLALADYALQREF
ncbi:MAG: polyprenyl synthetase family protein [Nitrospiraceae bacterium]|nr:polyprenyl synthetase family protein [Nitrospiraceae bacterium]MDA8326406.1 polyprenyl synthetase family protein [Nitrospiraceae bacterium]